MQLVIAQYRDLETARLAAGDLQTVGVAADRITLAEATFLIVVSANDPDQAMNVRSFLEEDGAESVEIRSDEVHVPSMDTIPTVPASS